MEKKSSRLFICLCLLLLVSICIGDTDWVKQSQVDAKISTLTVDLSGAVVIYIDGLAKLRKVDITGNVNIVISTDPDVDHIQFGPDGSLFIVFSETQPLPGAGIQDGQTLSTGDYLLIRVNPQNNSVVGIDKDLSVMVWNSNTVSPNIQFDGAGNIYYLAKDIDEKLILRKYVDESNISNLINDNINILHWLVRTDGTIVMGGETKSNSVQWLRKLSPSGTLADIASPCKPGWILEFPDNRVYVGLLNDSFYYGVYKLSVDLAYINGPAAQTPYIGDSGLGWNPDYDVTDLTASKDAIYCKGFKDTSGTQLYGHAKTTDDKTFLLTGYDNYRTIVQVYPTPSVIVLNLVTTITLIRETLHQLLVPGTKQGIHKLILYDLAYKTELNLLFEEIEIYHLDVLPDGTILFDGLKISTNTYIVGMYERSSGAIPETAGILGYGYKELTSMDAKPSGFEVVHQSSSECTRLGDTNGDTNITPGDAQLAFEIYLERVTPTTCQTSTSDANCSGGTTPQDAQWIFEHYLGTRVLPEACETAGPQNILFQPYTGERGETILGLPRTEPEGTVVVPIFAAGAAPLKSFGLDIQFDPTCLEFIGIQTSAITQEFMAVDSNIISRGVVRVGGYGGNEGAAQNGLLLELVFRQKHQRRIGSIQILKSEKEY